MPEPIYVLMLFVYYFLNVLSVAMMLRAILSWFVTDGEGKLVRFLYTLTEPAIYPFRKLFYKLNWFQETPMDMAFIFSWMFLSVIEMVIMLLS